MTAKPAPAADPQDLAYQVIIGLEVHVELATKSKLFCGCGAVFGAPPNTNVCPVCLGLPGVLPVLNREAVRFAAKAAMALGCEVAAFSKFDRKNYFYPDLPKAYQISQFDLPLGQHGTVRILTDEHAEPKTVRIRRIHLEEDAGKLNHLGERLGDARGSLVDLNRAGVPLIEIVSEPDMRSPAEARAYVTELRTVLRYLDISDLRMAEGSMRVDANISLRPRDYTGSLEDLPRVEIKNLNSIRNVQRALEYEVERQARQLAEGERIVLETRGFNETTGRTFSQRSKEEAHDYRYFPEPDLPPLVLSQEWLDAVRHSLPPTPDQLREGLSEEGLPAKDIEVLVADPDALHYFETLRALHIPARAAANWMLSDLSRLMNAQGVSFGEVGVTPEGLAGLLGLIDGGKISGRMAKEVLEQMFATGASAEQVVANLGIQQISDSDALRKEAAEVLSENPKVVEDYLGGKEKALGFLVGQVMKRTRGQAKPDLVNELLREMIQERRR